ncbi:hypothetical protein [Halobacterium hubeiense]|uniref:hypothetical protein n=1 Tax=Halobacterium hubeiense TaxID=1407499 RepID=UPI000B7E7CEA|nr:hypothetical protein [Halobacterium hubeiense]
MTKQMLMIPATLSERRKLSTIVGVASGLACLAGILASDIYLTGDQPVLRFAALGATALGVGSLATVSCYLFIEQSLLVPALAGFSYIGAVLTGLFVSHHALAIEALLTKWVYLAGIVLIGGIFEYVARRGLQYGIGRFGPRPLD